MVKINEENLSRIVSNAIHQLIEEEGGISKIVTKYADYLSNRIKSLIKDSEKIKMDGYVIRKNGFEALLFEDFSCEVRFTFYNFSNIDYYERFLYDNSNIFIGRSSYNERFIEINFFAINGEIDEKTLYDQCQHEVSHIYKAKMKGGNLFSDKRREFYRKAASLMSSDGNGGFDNLVGTIAYISFEQEQNAYVNGMYSLLMNTCKSSSEAHMVFIQSDAYELFKRLKYFSIVLDSLDDEDAVNLNNALSKLGGQSIDWIKNKLEAVTNTYGGRLIKGYNKALNDLKELDLRGDCMR